MTCGISKEEFLSLVMVAGEATPKKLFKKIYRLDVRKYSFSNSVVDNWNSLPDSCVNCTTVYMFKMHIASKMELDM